MKIIIDRTEINYFTNITLTLKLDSIASTFEFATYYQPQDLEYQRIFKPLQYKDVEIYNSKDKLIFTGTILNHRFTSNKCDDYVRLLFLLDISRQINLAIQYSNL